MTDTPAATATETLTPTATVTLTPSDTPEPTASPTPTVPADGVIGEVDLLALMSRLPDENPDAVFWNDGRMTPEDEFWRLGVGFETPEDIHALTVPVDVFEQYYGEGAAERVFAVEATLTLQTFNPALLGEEGVVFGAMVTPPESDTPLADGAGLHIDVAQPGVLNIGTRQQGRVNVVVQRSVNAVIVRVRLERTPEGGVIVFFNGERVGNAVQPTGTTPGGAFCRACSSRTAAQS